MDAISVPKRFNRHAVWLIRQQLEEFSTPLSLKILNEEEVPTGRGSTRTVPQRAIAMEGGARFTVRHASRSRSLPSHEAFRSQRTRNQVNGILKTAFSQVGDRYRLGSRKKYIYGALFNIEKIC
jgi:hypothetical protein